MTREEYGNAYEKGYKLTTRFLASRGVPYSSAEDTAQAAWVRGWERIAQLRNTKMVVIWVNSIAMNLYRGCLRGEPLHQIRGKFPEVPTGPNVNLAAIDVGRMLRASKESDRLILTRHYFEGDTLQEIAQAHGCSPMAVRIRMLRARRSLAKKLADSHSNETTFKRKGGSRLRAAI